MLVGVTVAVAAARTSYGKTPAGPVAEVDERDPAEGPRRIITIGPNAAEILCGLGACERIVAVDKFCVFPPELKDRPKVGGLFDPDLEKIAALRPELIVLRGRNEAIAALAQRRGIRLFRDRTESLNDIPETIRALGALLGRDERASAMIRDFEARLEQIRARVEGRERPRVLLTVARQPDRLANLLTSGNGTFLDEMLTVAGGENVFGELDMAYPQVSVESILAKRPEVIIELLPEVAMTAEREAQMRGQWEEVGGIPAVVQGRIYFVTDDHCLIPSPRYVEIIEKVSRLLHPEADGE